MSDETFERGVQKVAGWLRHFIDPGQVTELRALAVSFREGDPEVTWSGFFDGQHLEAMAREALNLSGRARGVYWVMNPLRPSILQRRANFVAEVKPRSSSLAKDTDVEFRRWLLIDVDRRKTSGNAELSATEEEKLHCWNTTERVIDWMSSHTPCEPFVCDSGNGFHLLYRLVDIPNQTLPIPEDDPIRLTLQAVSLACNDEYTEVDTRVYNPARICKLPGTLACKGPSTEERPHRRARILKEPTHGCHPSERDPI